MSYEDDEAFADAMAEMYADDEARRESDEMAIAEALRDREYEG